MPAEAATTVRPDSGLAMDADIIVRKRFRNWRASA
jgi:hypothetical protein